MYKAPNGHKWKHQNRGINKLITIKTIKTNIQIPFTTIACVRIMNGSRIHPKYGILKKKVNILKIIIQKRRKNLIFFNHLGVFMEIFHFFLKKRPFSISNNPPKGHIQKQKKFPKIAISKSIIKAGRRYIKKYPPAIAIVIDIKASILEYIFAGNPSKIGKFFLKIKRKKKNIEAICTNFLIFILLSLRVSLKRARQSPFPFLYLQVVYFQ